MADRIQHSNHSSHRLLQSSDAGIETAPQNTSNKQEKSSQNYWSYYTDFNIPVWKRALGGVLLPVVGPLTLFGVGCEDAARSEIPIEDSGPVPDGGGAQDERTVVIENHPPVWNVIPDQQLVEGAELSLQLSAMDPDGHTLTFIPDTLPRGAGLTAEGLFNWTPDFDQAGEYEVGVRVSDGVASVPISFKVVVENRNRAPVMQPIPPKTGEEGTPLAFQVYASDPDGDQLQFSAENLPEGAVLSPSTGLFEWTPNYEQAGEYNNLIVKVSDGINTTAQGVVIQVRETNRPPIFEQPLALQTVQEGQELFFTVVASDPDHDRVALSVDPQTLPQNADFDEQTGEFRWTPSFEDGGKIYKVKFFTADGSATSEHNVSIRVDNTNRAPEVIGPLEDQRIAEGQTLSFPVEVSDPDEGDVVDFDVQLPPGAFIDAGNFIWTPNYDQAAEAAYEAVFEATDNHLASTIRSVRIFVENTNRAPSVVVPGRDFTVAEGGRLTFVVSGMDADEGEVAVSISPDSHLPEGARFAEGIFDWTPNYDQARPAPYEIVFRATDAEGVTADERIEITVQNTNRSPEVSPIENQEVSEGATLDFQISANDPDNDPLTFIPEELPPGAELTPAGHFSWTPNFDQAGNNYHVGFRVSDGQGEVPASFNIDVENTNRLPTIDPIEAQRVVEGGYLSFFVTADDPDAEEVSVRATSLPNGAVFHEDTGEFEWSPDYDQAGEHQVVFEATDGHDTVSHTAPITVENTNRPPTIIPIPDMTVAEGAQLVFAVGAVDPDEGDVTLSAPVLPGGATFEESIFGWIPNYEQAQAEPYRAVFRAADEEGATDDEVVNITVQNTNRPPVFDPIDDQVVAEGEEVSFVVSARDPDGQPVVLGVNNLPDGAQFDPETGAFSWVPRFDQAGSYAIEFTAMDVEGTTAIQIVRVAVENTNRAPVFDLIDDQVVNEGEDLSFHVNAVSPDGLDVQIGVVNLPRGAHFDSETRVFSWTPGYDQAGEYELEFIAMDEELTATEPVKIIVQNVNRAPVFNFIPEQNVLCGEQVQFVVSARDPDGDRVEVGVDFLPDGALFDSQSGLFEWSPGYGQKGQYNVVFLGQDGNLESEANVVINVRVIELVSVAFDGGMADGHSLPWGSPEISGDGRFVVFLSQATNLVQNDLNGRMEDVFVHDRRTNMTRLANINTDGVQANRDSDDSAISANGRFVAFHSSASNLVQGDENDRTDVFVYDREAGSIERVVVIDPRFFEEDVGGSDPSISADGRFIAFESATGVLVRDRESGLTENVSVNSDGEDANDYSSWSPVISANGRFVAFLSTASNLVPRDRNGEQDVFVHDRETGLTERVSVNSDGVEANEYSHSAAISTDGRFVTFSSAASNLVPGDENGEQDVFVHDRETGSTERVNVNSDGVEANEFSWAGGITADGRFVSFASSASNLVPGDENEGADIFVRDLETGLTKMVSIDVGDESANEESFSSKISEDGRYVVFTSNASDLVLGDRNHARDIFVASLACFFDLENE